MSDNHKRVFISHGRPEHYEDLDELARDNRPISWTVHRAAQSNDLVVFYIKRPLSSFVAWGVVDGEPELQDEDSDWAGNYMAQVSSITMIDPPVPIQLMRKHLPSWPWLKTPQAAPQVPINFVNVFLDVLGIGEPSTNKIIRIADEDNIAPERLRCEVSRIVRDTALGNELKRLCRYHCQVCDINIPVPATWVGYIEIHHLRPLGRGHDGADSMNNMLVLCPNCHAQFDLLAMAICPQTNMVVKFDGIKINDVGVMKFVSGHKLDQKNILYHWSRFEKATS